MSSVMDFIAGGRVPKSPFKLASAPKEEPETLRKSIFVFDEEPEQLSPDDVAHLTLGHRYGKPFHRLEVEALMKSFESDGDVAHLRRAAAILEHRIELEAPHEV